MSTHGRKSRLTSLTVDLGCSSGFCRNSKLSSIFTPKPKPKPKPKDPKPKHKKPHQSSPSTWQRLPSPSKASSSNATWTYSDYETQTSRAVQGFGRIGGESVAVEKDSDDPYLDFRSSILQMIMEKEIYSKEDLKELLNCFLQLNSPYYHGIIIRAFTEIWHGVFFAK